MVEENKGSIYLAVIHLSGNDVSFCSFDMDFEGRYDHAIAAEPSVIARLIEAQNNFCRILLLFLCCLVISEVVRTT